MRAPPPTPTREAHPFLTHDMIHEIPQALEATLHAMESALPDLEAFFSDSNRLALTGSGSAYFAALLGSEPLRRAGVGMGAVPAFELAHYEPLDRDAVVVAISHSGVTKATVDAVAKARETGAKTLALTHHADRPIQDVAHRTVVVGNGPDRSKCHTKCYAANSLAATQTVLAWLRAQGEGVSSRLEALASGLTRLPNQARAVLADLEPPIEAWLRAQPLRDHWVVTGGGPNRATALEAALKAQETSYLPAQGFETEEALHGPWNALSSDSLVVTVAVRGPARDRARDLVDAARILGASVVAVVTEGDGALQDRADLSLAIPPVDELLSPYLAILPLYLLAYYEAVRRGHNPDELHYLESRYWDARNVIFPPGTH